MGGLRKYLCVAAVVCCAQAVVPGAYANHAPPSDTCAVIGDVLNPNTFRCPAAQPLQLNAALLAAQSNSPSATVLIVRGSGSQVWTETVGSGTAESGSLLMPGDVVVVHAVAAPGVSYPSSAVLVQDGRPVVLALQPHSGVPVVVADVMLNCQQPLSRLVELKLISARPGRSSPVLSPDFEVQHGDVLVLTSGGSPRPRRAAGFSPMFSEWPATAQAPSDPSAPGVPGQIVQTLSATNTQAPSPSAEISAVPEPAVALSLPPVSSAFSEMNDQAQDEQTLPAADLLRQDFPFQTVSQGSGQIDDLGVGSLTPPVSELSSIIPVVPGLQATAAVPPADPSLEESPVRQATGWNVWNFLFIGGLLAAGGLIIFGWLKSEAEMRSALSEAMSAADGDSRPDAVSPDQFVKARPELRIAESTRLAEVSEPIDETHTSAGTAVPAGLGLVDRSEWYGGEWLKPASESNASAGSFVQTVSSAQIHSDDFSGPGVLIPASTDAVSSMGGSDAFAPTVPEGPSEMFSELNDLIENRLPVDLCQARLPLRVTLFGRPAGPVRLRIDAAHTQLAGPHAPRSGHHAGGAERKQAMQPVSSGVLAAGAVSEMVAKNVVPAMPSPGTPPGSASLDRALNFLHEQGE